MQIGILHSKVAYRTDGKISPLLSRLLLLEISQVLGSAESEDFFFIRKI